MNSREQNNKTKTILKRVFSHEIATLAIILIALIAIISGITNGLTTRRANLMNILLHSSIRGVASVGQTFVILTAGVDVSVGGIGLMVSILGASMMTQNPVVNILGDPLSMYKVIPMMLLAGAGWGAVNGSIVGRVGVPALIVTLAMWQITDGVGWVISGGRSLGGQPDNLATIGSGTIGGIPIPVIIFIIIAVIGYFVLNYTTYGRSIYAIGGNPISAWLSGIKVKALTSSVYIISGFLAGIAGLIIIGRTMSASMRTLTGLELDSIAATCVGGVSLMGGRGNLIGVVLGVLIIGVIDNTMSVMGADPATTGIAKGAIILAAVITDYVRRRH